MNKFEKYKDILFSTLAELTRLIIAGNDKRDIFQRLLDCCLIVLEAERVYLLELDGNTIIRYSKSRGSGVFSDLVVEEVNPVAPVREWMIREGQERGRLRRGEELGVDLPNLAHCYLDDHAEDHPVISAPLVSRRSMFGLLVAIHPVDGGIYSAEDIKLVTVLANQAAIALENRLLYEKVEREAITDALTSVYNYRFLMNSLDGEIKRAKRFRQVFSFVMLDVDNLKEYNDRLGHLVGSQALRHIAYLIKMTCRDVDLVSKYGGDEFGILLPQTELTGASTVTQRVIDAVREFKFDGVAKGLLTCSAGISAYPDDGKTPRELIAAADRALYQAKGSGKNQLVTTRDILSHVRS